MREVRTDPEAVGHAVVDGINTYLRDILRPRCPALADLLDGPEDEELLRLKYEVAAAVAARWAISYRNDEA